MRSKSVAREAAKNARTVVSALSSRGVVPVPSRSATVVIATSSRRDRDLVEPFDAEPAIQLVLVPVRDDGADPVVRRDLQHPGLVEVEVLLLVGHREKVIGLSAVDGDLGHGAVFGGHPRTPLFPSSVWPTSSSVIAVMR